MLSRLQSIRQMMGGNPQGMYEQLMRTNPQFADFVRQNQGKTPEEIAREHGIDYGMIQRFLN